MTSKLCCVAPNRTKPPVERRSRMVSISLGDSALSQPYPPSLSHRDSSLYSPFPFRESPADDDTSFQSSFQSNSIRQLFQEDVSDKPPAVRHSISSFFSASKSRTTPPLAPGNLIPGFNTCASTPEGADELSHQSSTSSAAGHLFSALPNPSHPDPFDPDAQTIHSLDLNDCLNIITFDEPLTQADNVATPEIKPEPIPDDISLAEWVQFCHDHIISWRCQFQEC